MFIGNSRDCDERRKIQCAYNQGIVDGILWGVGVALLVIVFAGGVLAYYHA